MGTTPTSLSSINPFQWTLAGLGALSGGIGAANPGTTTTNSSGSTSQSLTGSSSGSSSSSPNYDPYTLQVRNNILSGLYNNVFNTPIDLSGYKASGGEQINNTFDASNKGLAQSLAAKGLSSSPVAANAMAVSNAGRAGQIATFNNSIPLLQEQIQQQRMQQLMSFFTGLPVGTNTSTSQSQAQFGNANTNSNSTQSTTPNGGVLGGILGGLGAVLGAL